MTQNEEKVVPEQLDEQQQQAILEKFDRESVTRSPSNKSVAWFIAAIAIFYSLFHLFITFNPLPELIQRSAHVAIGLVLIFLLYPARQSSSRQSIPWLDWLLALASLATFLYLWKEYQAIMTTRGGIPNTLDIVFAILAVVLVVEGARRVMGWMLPILGLVFLSYPFFSHYDWVPDRLLTRPYSISDIFGQMYLKTEGLYSSAIGASVTFIFLFILFGAFLAKSGMGKLFNDLAMALAGHKQGGPAKVAVISSGFMGSINGTAVANVVGTGSFTIPLMKKIGYHKNFAGAVEASASVGGQILPPVMGASAFIMAETTGVSYGTIALAATLPALLYYLGVMAQVHFRAGKDNLKGVPKADLPRVKDVLKACQLCRGLHHCLNCDCGEFPQIDPYGLQRNIRSARRWCKTIPFGHGSLCCGGDYYWCSEPDQLWLCHDLLNYEHRCRQPIFNAVLYHDCINDFRHGTSFDSSLYHYRDYGCTCFGKL